ncbi:hypothetical protein LCGC14_3101680, partial [marine sediment metagenome]
DSPFVGNAQFDRLIQAFNAPMVEIDCTFAPGQGFGTLLAALRRIRNEAEDAVRSGAGHIVLTDQHASADKAPMPMILATSAVHSWLTKQGLRTFCSLNVRAAECIDPHYFAVLIGCGATVVNAYLAEDSIADRIERGLIDGSLTEAMRRYRNAIDQGLLKIMAKMGISVISSYRGGLNFEAVGLSRAMVAEYFPGMHSRISGIGVNGIQRKLEGVHALGWKGGLDVLPIGGFYKARRSGETHAWEATSMHMLQVAVEKGHDLEKIEKLMELERRWKADQAREAYYLALAEFKREPVTVTKDKVNTQFGSMYTGLGNLANTVNAAMAPFGLNASWDFDQSAGIKVT